MKKKINNKILYMIVLVLVAMFASIGTVFAQKMISSREVFYNNDGSSLKATNVQGAIDELYIKCAGSEAKITLARYLKSLDSTDTIIADDGTVDHNMRYTGPSSDVDNYVYFEGEKWRIIGVFNNISNGALENEKIESRVKIIYSTSLGGKVWNSGGTNIWKDASLNTYLQSTKYASSDLIDEATWYLGSKERSFDVIASQAYEIERTGQVAEGNELTWTGKVGLLYPSDFGFASSSCKDGAYTLNSYGPCKETNWLALTQPWYITPRSDSKNIAYYGSSRMDIDGNANYPVDTNSRYVLPVVYLKSDVICNNCLDEDAGTIDNPFEIELNK